MYKKGEWNDAICGGTKSKFHLIPAGNKTTTLAFICEAPIIQGYDEDGVAIPSKPIYPDGPVGPQPEPEKDSIAGEVIGIIVGVCVGIVFIMYGMFALGKKQGVELGVAAGTVNALGSTIDKAGNSISE